LIHLTFVTWFSTKVRYFQNDILTIPFSPQKPFFAKNNGIRIIKIFLFKVERPAGLEPAMLARQLGRLMEYQLSNGRLWWQHLGSNQGSSDYRSDALPLSYAAIYLFVPIFITLQYFLD
jgi:hypothetical protein